MADEIRDAAVPPLPQMMNGFGDGCRIIRANTRHPMVAGTDMHVRNAAALKQRRLSQRDDAVDVRKYSLSAPHRGSTDEATVPGVVDGGGQCRGHFGIIAPVATRSLNQGKALNIDGDEPPNGRIASEGIENASR